MSKGKRITRAAALCFFLTVFPAGGLSALDAWTLISPSLGGFDASAGLNWDYSGDNGGNLTGYLSYLKNTQIGSPKIENAVTSERDTINELIETRILFQPFQQRIKFDGVFLGIGFGAGFGSYSFSEHATFFATPDYWASYDSSDSNYFVGPGLGLEFKGSAGILDFEYKGLFAPWLYHSDARSFTRDFGTAISETGSDWNSGFAQQDLRLEFDRLVALIFKYVYQTNPQATVNAEWTGFDYPQGEFHLLAGRIQGRVLGKSVPVLVGLGADLIWRRWGPGPMLFVPVPHIDIAFR